MANTKVSALTAATPLTTDLVYLVDDPAGTPVSKQCAISAVDTLLAATTQTLTNKTLTSPTLTGPVLGTPASGDLQNCTALPVGSVTGLGTGVATALAVNVGSAGAPVTFNGDAGTPSALVGTNISGTAASLTVGATTGVEAGADVTDTANVTSAGALMDSECTSLADVKALDQSVVSGAAPTFVGTNFSGTAASLTVGATTGVEAGADVTDTTNVTAAGALMDSECTSLASVKALDQGVATTDSPQFAGVNVGAATDTTITRTGAGVIAVEGVEVTTNSGTQTLTNKTLTSPVLNTGVSGTAVKDEDDMTSDSATHLATQQSIKAYVDATIGTGSGSAYQWVGAGAMAPSASGSAATGTKDDGTNVGAFDYFAFDGAANEDLFFDWLMPENWDGGTVKLRFVWSPGAATATATEGVVWEISAISVADDDAWDTAMGTAVHVDDTVTAGVDADTHITAQTADVTIGGTPTAGDLITFRVQRLATDANDAMTEDGWLRGVVVEYTENSNIMAWGAKVVTKSTATAYTVGTTNALENYGGVIYVTGAATITLPAVVDGMSVTVITIGAVAVSLKPNASDLIYLNGVALDDGDKATNTSAAGDIAVATYYDATGWSVVAPDWTDTGA